MNTPSTDALAVRCAIVNSPRIAVTPSSFQDAAADCPRMAEDGNDRGKLAGSVGDIEPKSREAAFSRKLTGEHA